LKRVWEKEPLLLRSKYSISHNHFKTIDINENDVVEIMFSKLKKEYWRHNLNIA